MALGMLSFLTVPLVIKEAFKLDKDVPLPMKVAAETAPDAVMLLIENDRLASRSTIVSGLAMAVAVVRAFDSEPVVMEDASNAVKEAPLPEKEAAETAPDAVILLIENDRLVSRSTIVSGLAREVALVREFESVPDVINDASKLDSEAPPPNTEPFCNREPVKLMSPTT